MNLIPIVKKLIACLCVLLHAVSCVMAQRIIPVDTGKLQTLRIDPSNAMGGNASDFFTEVNYIPLETTNESLFGSISRMEITDDYFIISDWNTHSILIFNKNGKFHAKIKGSETAPIYSFAVNKFTRQIMYSKDNYKTYVYSDFNGKTIRSVKTGGEYARDEVNDGSDHYFFAPDKAVSDYRANDIDSTSKEYKVYSKSLIVYSDDKNKVYAQGLPFDKREVGANIISTGLGPVTSFGVDTAFFYSKPYTYRIYTLTPNSIQFSYQFIFPLQSSLPIDFLYNAEYKTKHLEYVQKHPGVIFSLSNVFRVNDNLLFKAAVWGNDSKEDNLIYNLKSGTLIAYKHILQDERSYFLPIYDDGNYSFSNSGLLACTGGYIYSSVSSLGMFQYREKYADQKATYPPALDQYFKKGNKRDNPVIIQLKLKEQL